MLLKLRGIWAKPCLTVLERAYLDYSRYLDYFPFIKHHFLSMTYKIVLKNPHQLSSSNRLRDYIAQLAALPLLEAYIREQSLLKINIETHVCEARALAFSFGHSTSPFACPGQHRARAACSDAWRAAGTLLETEGRGAPAHWEPDPKGVQPPEHSLPSKGNQIFMPWHQLPGDEPFPSTYITVSYSTCPPSDSRWVQ